MDAAGRVCGRGQGHGDGAGIRRGDDQVTLPALPRDRHPASGHALPERASNPWRPDWPHGTGVASISRSISAVAGVWSASYRNAAAINGAAFFSRWLYSLCPSSRGNR